MTDGWRPHDGGPCPVAPGRLVMVNGDETVALPVSSINWASVKCYRTFARVNPPDPSPSDFVRETAARIMAGFAASGNAWSSAETMADEAVSAALALEKALQEVGK